MYSLPATRNHGAHHSHSFWMARLYKISHQHEPYSFLVLVLACDSPSLDAQEAAAIQVQPITDDIIASMKPHRLVELRVTLPNYISRDLIQVKGTSKQGYIALPSFHLFIVVPTVPSAIFISPTNCPSLSSPSPSSEPQEDVYPLPPSCHFHHVFSFETSRPFSTPSSCTKTTCQVST